MANNQLLLYTFEKLVLRSRYSRGKKNTQLDYEEEEFEEDVEDEDEEKKEEEENKEVDEVERVGG